MTAAFLTATRSGSLQGHVEVPGDKSLSHRAVLLAALAEGTSRIAGLSNGQDVGRTIEAVQALGATVARAPDGTLLVTGGPWHSPGQPIDCGNSGTTARLLMGAVAGRPVTATFVGDDSLGRRPMARVTEPLQQMGARMDGGDHLPVTVHGGALRGLHFFNEKSSAQLKSAILLAGLGAGGQVEVVEPHQSRDHSERMLAAFGVEVVQEMQEDGLHIRLPDRRTLRGAEVEVVGDPSSAAFPLVAALATPGSAVTVRNVLNNPLRTGLYATLREMGADLSLSGARTASREAVADFTARTSRLRAVTVPAARAPSMIDEYPILAVAAAFAEGETAMHGLAELRVKESDRLAAIVAGLTACGVESRVDGDSLFVTGRGGDIPGGDVATHGDHRIAMSFLTLGLASRASVRVDGAAMIATSFPGFVPLMRSLGARIEES